MEDIKNKIEAVLFTIGRFIELEELAKIVGIGSVGSLKEVLEELKKEYNGKDGSLEVINEENKWRLNIKNVYGNLANKLVGDAELDSPSIKTLAVIAYNQPAKQSDVIHTRGNKAYDHISQLLDRGFISSEKFGRTRQIKLTKTFYDYFDINRDEIKTRLQQAINDVKKESSEQNIEVKDEKPV